jgi:predicted dehydrogenase
LKPSSANNLQKNATRGGTLDAPPKVRAAVVGLGHIAQQHLGFMTAWEKVDVAVCDLSAAVAESTADRMGIEQWYVDYEEMLASHRPAIVHVTTPVSAHVPLATQAIAAGANVIVEKPIAPGYEQWRRLREQAQQAGLWVIENHNYRFNPPVQRILDEVFEGRFGEIVHVEVLCSLNVLGDDSPFSDANVLHPSLALPGGVISDFVTHLAYLVWLFVGEHRELHTIWSKRESQGPLPCDEMRCVIEAERGTGCLSFSAHSQPEGFWLRVYGTQASATLNLYESKLHIDRIRQGPRPLNTLWNGLDEARNSAVGALSGLARKLSGGPNAYIGLWNLLEKVYTALESDTDPPISMQEVDDVNRLVWDVLATGPQR